MEICVKDKKNSNLLPSEIVSALLKTICGG